ncbi:hypothetical protein FRC01_004341 [Tulasnella sp. 417]|nr:hypothetical protein FRC01_004341 [Tulasnella sp. 417]
MSFVGHTITHSPLASPSGLRYAMASAFPFNYPSTDVASTPAYSAKKITGTPLASPGPKANNRQTPKLPDAFNQHHSIIALRESNASGRPRRSSFAVSAIRAPDSPFTGPGSPSQPHQQKKPRRLSFAELPTIARDPQALPAGRGVVGLGFVATAEGPTRPNITKSRRDSILERVPTPYPKDEEAESYFDVKFGASEEKV